MKKQIIMKSRIRLLLLFSVLLLFSGCASVQPWQRVYLNDAEMQMGFSSAEAFENYVHSIRTGSVVAGSKKTGGGCGCN